MEDSSQAHDFDMYLYCLGNDDVGDLGAEIEMGFGEEQEIHTITTPSSVYILKGLVHCPLNFKRVDRPILFVHVTITAKYNPPLNLDLLSPNDTSELGREKRFCEGKMLYTPLDWASITGVGIAQNVR